jgi:hypothetical protein
MLKTIAFIRGHKWTSMMVKRVYFGNWLREYAASQIYFLLFGFIAFVEQAKFFCLLSMVRLLGASNHE